VPPGLNVESPLVDSAVESTVGRHNVIHKTGSALHDVLQRRQKKNKPRPSTENVAKLVGF